MGNIISVINMKGGVGKTTLSIGIVTELIYSKVIFNKNKEIFNFIKDVFGIELKDYILKSRTMIVAKVSRVIINSENVIECKKELYEFINLQIEILKKTKI